MKHGDFQVRYVTLITRGYVIFPLSFTILGTILGPSDGPELDNNPVGALNWKVSESTNGSGGGTGSDTSLVGRSQGPGPGEGEAAEPNLFGQEKRREPWEDDESNLSLSYYLYQKTSIYVGFIYVQCLSSRMIMMIIIIMIYVYIHIYV